MGEVIRYMYLSTHYRKPLDFSDKSLQQAEGSLHYLYRAIEVADSILDEFDEDFIAALYDDMNTHLALVYLHELAKSINKSSGKKQILLANKLRAAGNLLGILQMSDWFAQAGGDDIEEFIRQRNQAKQDKNWQLADQIRADLSKRGIIIEDTISGTKWRKKN